MGSGNEPDYSTNPSIVERIRHAMQDRSASPNPDDDTVVEQPAKLDETVIQRGCCGTRQGETHAPWCGTFARGGAQPTSMVTKPPNPPHGGSGVTPPALGRRDIRDRNRLAVERIAADLQRGAYTPHADVTLALQIAGQLVAHAAVHPQSAEVLAQQTCSAADVLLEWMRK